MKAPGRRCLRGGGAGSGAAGRGSPPSPLSAGCSGTSCTRLANMRHIEAGSLHLQPPFSNTAHRGSAHRHTRRDTKTGRAGGGGGGGGGATQTILLQNNNSFSVPTGGDGAALAGSPPAPLSAQRGGGGKKKKTTKNPPHAQPPPTPPPQVRLAADTRNAEFATKMN